MIDQQRRGGPPGGLYLASFQLAAVGSAAGVARAFVRQRLTDLKLPGLVEDSALVMSELVTNAVRATGLSEPGVRLHDVREEHLIDVQLRVIDSSLFVEVWDRSPQAPVKQQADDESENGRGLVLVEALTRRWGVYRPAAGGKVVWAELSLGELTFCPVTRHVQPCHVPCPSCPARGQQ